MIVDRTRKFNTIDLVLMAVFTALTVVGAYLKIPIPYVPITLQLTFTTLAGLLLGPCRGAVSVVIYIIAGLAGLPVFTQGGGIGYVLKPTFGYIIGFAFGALVAGFVVGKRAQVSYKRFLAASLLSVLVCYLFGSVYFYFITNFYLNKAMDIANIILICVIPFIPGDVILSFLAAFVAVRLNFLRVR